MYDQEAIERRAEEIKETVKNDYPILLSVVVSAYKLDVTDRPLTRYQPSSHGGKLERLEYLCDRFGLENLEHARIFEADIDAKLKKACRKVATSETELGLQLNNLSDVLIEAIIMDALKQEQMIQYN